MTIYTKRVHISPLHFLDIQKEVLDKIKTQIPDASINNLSKNAIWGNLSPDQLKICFKSKGNCDVCSVRIEKDKYCKNSLFIRALREEILRKYPDSFELKLENGGTHSLYQLKVNTTLEKSVEVSVKDMSLISLYLEEKDFFTFWADRKYRHEHKEFKLCSIELKEIISKFGDTIWSMYHYYFDAGNISKITRLVLRFSNSESENVHLYNTKNDDYVGSLYREEKINSNLISIKLLHLKGDDADKEHLQLFFTYNDKMDNDSIYLGQFIKSNANGALINGTFILQRINELGLEENELRAKVKNIPLIHAADEGIDKGISDYFLEKYKNITKTPKLNIYTLAQLKIWLNSYKIKPHRNETLIGYDLYISSPLSSTNMTDEDLANRKTEIKELFDKIKDELEAKNLEIENFYYTPIDEHIKSSHNVFTRADRFLDCAMENIKKSKVFVILLHFVSELNQLTKPTSAIFEAGIAMGLNKPIIIICKNEELIPSFLSRTKNTNINVYILSGKASADEQIVDYVAGKLYELLS